METAVVMMVSASRIPVSAERELRLLQDFRRPLTNPLSAPTEAKVRKVMRMATHPGLFCAVAKR